MKLNPIRQNVWKCGNALVITIPTVAAEMLRISEGDTIQFLPEKVDSQDIVDRNNQEIVSKPSGIGRHSKSSEVKRDFLQKLNKYGVIPMRGKNSVYDIGSGCRIYLKHSKYHKSEVPYLFGLDQKVIQEHSNKDGKRFYIVFLAGNENNAYIFPLNDMIKWLTGVSVANDNNWKLTYTSDLKLRLTGKKPIEIFKYLNNFKQFNICQEKL